MMPRVRSKESRKSKRVDGDVVFDDQNWSVVVGQLKPLPGTARKADHLFKFVAEKLPWDSLTNVAAHLKKRGVKRQGVYMAHDSMGVARYGGRGNIFPRLRSHKRKYKKELVYFSFYIIENKTHEREIENAILRAAGPQMILNQRKVREGIDPGRVADYEPGTNFFRRKYARGTRPKRRKIRAARMKNVLR
jgi:hypothetical protein